jgi:Ca-activated chloride channel family protein
MSVRYPLVLVFAIVVSAAAVAGYVMLQRRRAAALARSGLGLTATAGRSAIGRHLPYLLILAAIPLLLVGVARPQATINVPRAAGTVVLVFDVSNSMAADDLKPTRLAAAQAAAREFIQAQPASVDIGVVAFGQQALAVQPPTAKHGEAIAALNRLKTGGGTSLGQAILAALSAIVGKPVHLPQSDATEPQADLGYWGSATIVLFSDGEDTGGPDAEAAAGVAGDAGVHIETVGIGTTQGTTIEVDGYQLGTALDEDLLTTIATTTGGSYHQARDAADLNRVTRSIDLRISTHPEPVELTALLAGAALLLLTVGGFLMTRWYGRIV